MWLGAVRAARDRVQLRLLAVPFLLTLSSAAPVGVHGGSTIEFQTVAQSAGEADGSAVVTVVLSAALGADVDVPFTLSGTAVDGTDYTIDASPLTILAGATSGDITVTLSGDGLDEADETVVLTLGAPTLGVLGTDTVHTLTILDDDAPPTVEFGSAAQSVLEDVGQAYVTVTLSAASGLDVDVPFTLAGTAVEGVDYTITASPLSIPAGALSADIVVTVTDDALHELSEALEVTLGAPTNGALGATSLHTLTLEDDDSEPTVEFAAAESSVGESAGPALLTVTLSAVSGLDVDVPFTHSGTALAGVDFESSPSPLTIPAGASSADIVVTLLSDALHEDPESVVTTLGAPSGATLGAQVAHALTILDDDAPPTLAFDFRAQRVFEDVGTFPIDLTLSAPAGVDVVAAFLVSGTATDGVDFTLPASPIVIPAGETVHGLVVTVLDDITTEPPERLVVTLQPGPTGAQLGAITAHRAQIVDDGGDAFIPQVAGLRPSMASLSFADESAGNVSAAQTVVLRNTQVIPITFKGIKLGGLRPEQFSVSYPGPLPIVLNPGDSTTVDIAFSPDAGGDHVALAIVRQQPSGVPRTELPLDGLAVGFPGAEILVHGGDLPYTDIDGDVWAPEYGHATGTSALTFNGRPIQGTLDPQLYHTGREGGFFEYAFDLPNGWYDVRLHFTDPNPAHQVGDRVMDIGAQAVLVLDDLDILAEAGAPLTAFVAPAFRVQVGDGTLTLQFAGKNGADAIVHAIEVRSVPIITADVTSVDFGIVEQQTQVMQVVTLTNDGLLDGVADLLTFVLDGNSVGNGNDFFVRLNGVDFYGGGVSSVSHSIMLDLPVGQGTPIEVFFAPTLHAENSLELELGGNFDPVRFGLSGTGGANPGWGFLHPVLDYEPPLVVDYEGDGLEAVQLLGSESHTHEPGQSIVAHQWRVDAAVVSNAADPTVSLPLGGSIVDLTITDDNVSPNMATDSTVITVHPADEVPGVLVSYYSGAGAGGALALLDAVPARADYIERIEGALLVEVQGGTVGGSPFNADVMLRCQATIDIAQTQTTEFVPVGGSDFRLELDGVPASGPQSLAIGEHALEVRFAVASLSELPVRLDVLVDGVPANGFFDAVDHDENGVVPVIHDMPTVGLDLGGNEITIEGFGFYPKAMVTVHWGAADLTLVDFDNWSAGAIELTTPPGSGVIMVTVETPAGVSNPVNFEYSPSGPVPVKWTRLDDRTISLPEPTSLTFGPDGRLWVGRLSGHLTAITLDQDYFVTNITTYPGVSSLTNFDLLGVAFNPYDDPAGPVRVYVSHGEHFLNGGGAFTGESPYTGQVSVLEGPSFDTPIPLITGLPTSNHDHGVNGLEFDNYGDLLICMGGNTNAGVKWPLIGDLPESPLSGALLIAHLSNPSFDGALGYETTAGGVAENDQVFGDLVDLVNPGMVEVFGHGLRNPYDVVLTERGYLYTTDNGPNTNYGPASSSATTDAGQPHPQGPDELNLVEFGNYYGHPNRNRGRTDERQNVFHDHLEPPLPGVFRQALATLDSSTDGIAEYRAFAFNGQARGRLVAQKWNGRVYMIVLTSDGRGVVSTVDLSPPLRGLDLTTGPGGALLTADYSVDLVRVMVPDDVAAVGLTLYDITPWRAPATGGQQFVIGGAGFGTLANTSVTIGGVPAALSSVSSKRIVGTLPASPSGQQSGPVDVSVQVGIGSQTMVGAFRWLAAQPGGGHGFWTTGAPLPDELGEVAGGVIDGILYMVGEGTSKTYGYDIANDVWASNLAQRPFPGNHHAAEVFGGRLYLIGGLGAGQGKVQIYDPQVNTWSTGRDMPWGGGSCSSALISGKMYVCGGIVGNVTVNNCGVYDPLTDEWNGAVGGVGGAPRAPMPVGVNHAAAATDGSRLWVFGGRQGGNFPQPGFVNVQVYDPLSDSWLNSATSGALTSMPLGRGGTGRAVYYRDEFYVFGGESNSAVFDDVQAYNPAIDGWRTDADMPTARHGIFPIAFEGRVLVIGGGIQAGFSDSDYNEVFQR
jgi:glucose/arabinose dehydrogenase/N-acetylneuraminic acid mutarotase